MVLQGERSWITGRANGLKKAGHLGCG
jgi:hypothetical protein